MGCDGRPCKWKGSVTVTNQSPGSAPGTWTEVRIKLDGVPKASGTNIGPGQQVSWDFTSESDAVLVDCKDTDKEKTFTIEIVHGGNTYSRSGKVECKACLS